ncbi:MAG: NAD(P)H-dependent glycerol-3-phosphate dehydrogenase [Paracoccaceae bacterium]
MKVAILGAGAFGTALAIALGREGPVTLWGRQLKSRESPRLPGVAMSEGVSVSAEIADTDDAEVLLLAIPMQALGGFLAEHGARLSSRKLVACCKGVDLTTGLGPTALIRNHCRHFAPAILTGPSFAVDIARGLPTALTLACDDDVLGAALQERLSTSVLRLYRTTDVTGAELGGALKNVIAIASGVVIGAELGDSARAALMTRGYAEMVRFAVKQGAKTETLAGLSGFGDLVLTCTSDHSRNFGYGRALGACLPFDRRTTVEGVATAKAVTILAGSQEIEMPITFMVSALIAENISLSEAILALLSRPLKQE